MGDLADWQTYEAMTGWWDDDDEMATEVALEQGPPPKCSCNPMAEEFCFECYD